MLSLLSCVHEGACDEDRQMASSDADTGADSTAERALSYRLTRRKLSAADVQLLCSEIASLGRPRVPQRQCQGAGTQ